MDKADVTCTTTSPQPEIRTSLDKGPSGSGSREGECGDRGDGSDVAEAVDSSKQGYFAYFHTKEFYIVLILGYVVCVIAPSKPGSCVADFCLQPASSPLYHGYKHLHQPPRRYWNLDSRLSEPF